jgi:purine-binding chemotaxis protein CheW
MLQLVVLSLDDHQYALPLSTVERVLPIVEITQLPNAPEVVAGVVNIRGSVMPVFDLRKRLELPQRELKLTDQLVIALTAKRTVGLITDQVVGLIECDENDIIATDEVVSNVSYVSGVAKLKDGVMLIQDLDEFLSVEEQKLLDQAIKMPLVQSKQLTNIKSV